jgi:hypothetical protein
LGHAQVVGEWFYGPNTNTAAPAGDIAGGYIVYNYGTMPLVNAQQTYGFYSISSSLPSQFYDALNRPTPPSLPCPGTKCEVFSNAPTLPSGGYLQYGSYKETQLILYTNNGPPLTNPVPLGDYLKTAGIRNFVATPDGSVTDKYITVGAVTHASFTALDIFRNPLRAYPI